MSDHKKTDGGPAFPFPAVTGLPNGDFFYGWNGMTLRDYFAAKVMQGSIDSSWFHSDHNRSAKWCYEVADAMLKAREQ